MTDNEIPSPKLYAVYLLIILFILLTNASLGQIKIMHFNAGWNSNNDVEWFSKLTDCKTKGYTDITVDTDAQTKYKIAVVPTIIIFKDNEEVARFQADLSFKMVATREEFKDKNEINEKNIIGFASFILMVMFAITDLVTGFCGQELVINNTIYNSFVFVTLGCFGISSFEKIKKQ